MADMRSQINRYVYSRLMRFDLLPSTNKFCKQEDCPDRAIVWARLQSAGKGRMDRSFSSEDGGLYISFCYDVTDIMAKELMPLTGMCAVVVCEAVKNCLGLNAGIKWTNDIIVGRKKIAGILAETVFSDSGKPKRVVIGVGINVNQPSEAFEGELRNIATSAFIETEKTFEMQELIFALTLGFDRIIDCLKNKIDTYSYVEKYRVLCLTLGKEVHLLSQKYCPDKDPREMFAIEPERFPAVLAVDVDDSFGLVVIDQDGNTQAIVSGEVSVR